MDVKRVGPKSLCMRSANACSFAPCSSYTFDQASQLYFEEAHGFYYSADTNKVIAAGYCLVTYGYADAVIEFRPTPPTNMHRSTLTGRKEFGIPLTQRPDSSLCQTVVQRLL